MNLPKFFLLSCQRLISPGPYVGVRNIEPTRRADNGKWCKVSKMDIQINFIKHTCKTWLWVPVKKSSRKFFWTIRGMNVVETVQFHRFRLLFTATHEHNFSQLKYDQWLKNRRVRGSGVPFTEIDVLLCNKPTPDEIIATLPTIPRERESEDMVRTFSFGNMTDTL